MTAFARLARLTSQRIRHVAIWIAVPVVLLMAGCRGEEPPVQTVRSPVVPFDELFELADTVRLDPSILLGRIGYLDVSESGSLLVQDDANRITHLFSAEGRHLQSFSVPECLPDDWDFTPESSRFVGGGHVLVMKTSDPAVLFDLGGACVAAKRGGLHVLATSICARGDSIFAHKDYDLGLASTGVYDLALEPVAEIPIDAPRLVRLNFIYRGVAGRSVKCFDDGAYYLYREDMDANPVRARGGRTRYRPDFFVRRPDDVPNFSTVDDLRKYDVTGYPVAAAVFALDASTRMLFFFGLDERWTRRDGDSVYDFGLSVASNQDLFPGRSTVSPVWPQAAAGGYLYAFGEHEPLPGGKIGNPLVIRYRFIPPRRENV